MARRALPEDQRRAQAVRAGRRAVARGERPMYRVRIAETGWTVDGCPWLAGDEAAPRTALDAARASIAAWLEVAVDAIDVERVAADVTTMTPPTVDGQVYGG